MRHFAAILALAAATAWSSAFAASPAATRDWVKHFVATNSAAPVFDTTPISASVTNDQGAVERVTVSFENAKNDAFCVCDSSVAGMTNGTIFAKTSGEVYFNTGNSLCPAFSGSWQQFGSVKTDGEFVVVTNGSAVATNIVYHATNEVWMTRYMAQVGETTYTSVEIRAGLHIFTTTNSTASFCIRACRITDAQKRNLTTFTQARRFFLLDFLFPSAMAYSEGPHIVIAEEDIGDKHVTYWEQHLFTAAAEQQKITVGSVTITSANGQSMTYELDIDILNIGAGIDFCDLGGVHIATVDEIDGAIEATIGRNRAIQLSRSQDWQVGLLEKLEQAHSILLALKSTTCPRQGRDETAIPKDEPLPPVDHVCAHYDGVCGAWRCVECKKVYTSVDDAHPATHNFQVPAGKACAVCTICSTVPSAQSYHGGWQPVTPLDGSGSLTPHRSYCACACGRFNLNHLDVGDAVGYVADANPLVCLEVWRCGRCHQVVADAGAGIFASAGGETITKTTHDETTNGKYTAVSTNGHDICRLSYTCAHMKDGVSLGCGAVRVENFSHVPMWDGGVISSQGDSTHHLVKYPCVNGFDHWSDDTSKWAGDNPSWCGFCETTNKPHHWNDAVRRWNDATYPATAAAHKHLFVCGSITTLDGDDLTTCGKVIVSNEAHEVVATFYGDPEATSHAVSNRCGLCHGVFLNESLPLGREAHEPNGSPVFTFRDSATHLVSNQCAKCLAAYPASPVVADHVARGGSDAYGWFSIAKHVVSNLCDKCLGFYPQGLEDHIPWSVMPIGYKGNGAAWTHDVSNRCQRCAHDYVQAFGVACTADPNGWTLNNANRTTNGLDSVRCLYCTNTNAVRHAFVPDGDALHHCANGVGHLWEAHAWDATNTNKCTKCGWNRSTHQREDPTPQVETVVCPSCLLHPSALQCWGRYVGGVLDASQCAAGWDSANRRCGCVMCARSIAGCCLCTYSSIFPGSWDAPTSGSN